MEEGNRGETFMSKLKKQSLAFGASAQENFMYIKASIVGQVKKLSAKNEKEASEADLHAAKMQVEAADAAEAKKKQLGM